MLGMVKPYHGTTSVDKAQYIHLLKKIAIKLKDFRPLSSNNHECYIQITHKLWSCFVLCRPLRSLNIWLRHNITLIFCFLHYLQKPTALGGCWQRSSTNIGCNTSDEIAIAIRKKFLFY